MACPSTAIIVDATVGLGGHAQALLESAGPAAVLIGLDRDQDALGHARQRLSRFGEQVKLVHGHFGELARILKQLNVEALDAVLFDCGVSSLQLDQSQRGFSFIHDGPLDMRMDQSQQRTAAELINTISQKELTDLIRAYGQERWAGRIAGAIFRHRPFSTTGPLAEIIRQAVPPSAQTGRIHPATRTFQAIRIALNQELELLEVGLKTTIDALSPTGRIAVLTYHSLEERVVKKVFREAVRAKKCRVVTPKPVVPSEQEIKLNSRCRSARLRVAQGMGEAS